MHIPSKCNFRIEQSNGFSIEEHNRRLLPVKEDFNYNAYSLLVRQRDNSYLEDMSLMCLMTIISYDYQYIYIYIYTSTHTLVNIIFCLDRQNTIRYRSNQKTILSCSSNLWTLLKTRSKRLDVRRFHVARYVKIGDSSKRRWETGKEKSGDGGEGPFC